MVDITDFGQSLLVLLKQFINLIHFKIPNVKFNSKPPPFTDLHTLI